MWVSVAPRTDKQKDVCLKEKKKIVDMGIPGSLVSMIGWTHMTI